MKYVELWDICIAFPYYNFDKLIFFMFYLLKICKLLDLLYLCVAVVRYFVSTRLFFDLSIWQLMSCFNSVPYVSFQNGCE